MSEPYVDRLERENKALRDLLMRIRCWDMMNHASDAAYWRREIDNLCPPPVQGDGQ